MQSPICAVAGVLFIALWAVQSAAAAGPGAPAPGPAFQPPQRKTSPEAPKVFEYTREAGPDQTFFVVGEALTEDVVLWGTSDSAEQGQERKPKVQFANGRYLAATIPQRAYDGVFVAWVGSDKGWSEPFLLNAPEAWWVGPDQAPGGGDIAVYGRNLARRPDFDRSYVYLRRDGSNGVKQLEVTGCGKYRVKAKLPEDLRPGAYQLWVHTGLGGEHGWSRPLPLRVLPAPKAPKVIELQSKTQDALLKAVTAAEAAAPAVVRLPEGAIELDGTLKVPAGVLIAGAGRAKTILRFADRGASKFVVRTATPMRVRSRRRPREQHVAVWLSGDGAGVRDLGIQGTAMTDTGVLIRHNEFPRWAADCTVENVSVTGVEGKRAENRSVHFRYALRARVRGNELWSRCPLYLSGVRQCDISGNRLVPQTRFGGNATGAIQGRTNILEQCAIDDNVIASPPGAAAGAGTVQRMLWVSTGHGSVSNNYFARNRPDRARFAGVPGTDQNVGETILFEACQRYAYYGPIAAADDQSVTLPKTVPATPDDRLGTVKRTALPTDESGNELPVLPPHPEQDDGEFEAPADQYYVMVLNGRGMTQTRRVAKREGHKLLLDRPWRVVPDTGSVILLTTLFYRNLVVENEPRDGMSGIQLWYTCVENVVADNQVRHHRRQGISLFSCGSTLASSMPRKWNRGMGPCHFNTYEGNLVEDCTDGAHVSAGDHESLPIEFPRCAGNVMRHNSLLNNRARGLAIGGRERNGSDTSPSVVGTIVEFNMVRGSQGPAYRVGNGADLAVLRRNHAFFWQPPRAGRDGRHVVLEFEDPGTYATEQNVHESSYYGRGRVVPQRHVYKEPDTGRDRQRRR